MSHYIPQIIMIMLLTLPIGASLDQWTKKQIKGINILARFTLTSIFVFLLYWGGFFK